MVTLETAESPRVSEFFVCLLLVFSFCICWLYWEFRIFEISMILSPRFVEMINFIKSRRRSHWPISDYLSELPSWTNLADFHFSYIVGNPNTNVFGCTLNLNSFIAFYSVMEIESCKYDINFGVEQQGTVFHFHPMLFLFYVPSQIFKQLMELWTFKCILSNDCSGC